MATGDCIDLTESSDEDDDCNDYNFIPNNSETNSNGAMERMNYMELPDIISFTTATSSAGDGSSSVSQCSASTSHTVCPTASPASLKAEKKYMKQKEREEKQLKKIELKEAKAKKKEEQKSLKEALLAQKALAKNIIKSTKPGECLKYLTVIIESSVVHTAAGAKLLPMLQESGVGYSMETNAISGLIRWRRLQPSDSQNTNEEEEEPPSEDGENDVLILLPVDDLVSYVHASANKSPDEVSLSAFVEQLQDNLSGKRLTIAAQGTEKYFRDVKTSHQRQFRQDVLLAAGAMGAVGAVGAATQEPKRQGKKLKIGHVITRVELEQALVELEVSSECNVKLLETDDDVAKLIHGMTKAIAETPHKRRRTDVDFSFLPDGKHIVKVNKDGGGLLKLWQYQFLQFHNVSGEVACAIVAEYPSPQLLMKRYSQCSNQKEAENLLADIKVRRGAGVLETSRRIGKELSRRVYELMTCDDPNYILR